MFNYDPKKRAIAIDLKSLYQ
ncbi:hypothetical protein [Borreliella garinii]